MRLPFGHTSDGAQAFSLMPKTGLAESASIGGLAAATKEASISAISRYQLCYSFNSEARGTRKKRQKARASL